MFCNQIAPIVARDRPVTFSLVDRKCFWALILYIYIYIYIYIQWKLAKPDHHGTFEYVRFRKDPVFRRFTFFKKFIRNSYSSFFFKISDTVEVPIPNFPARCFWFNFGTDSAVSY